MRIIQLNKEQWQKFPVQGPPQHLQDTVTSELEYYTSPKGTVLGIVLIDNVDNDFSHVVLMYDRERKTYRGVSVGTSDPTIDLARKKLHRKMEKEAKKGRKYRNQGPSMFEEYPEVAAVVSRLAMEFQQNRAAKRGNN